MSLAEIQEQATRLTPAEQHKLAAFLKLGALKRDPERQAELFARIRRMKSGAEVPEAAVRDLFATPPRS